MPAGLPPGIPGMGLVIDGAVQQAPQPGRQASAVSGVFIGDGWGAAETLLPGSILLLCTAKRRNGSPQFSFCMRTAWQMLHCYNDFST